MRWTEIVEQAEVDGADLPTYRLVDTWTRDGRLKAETRGDRHGRYRWWPPEEVAVIRVVGRLTAIGVGTDLAFYLARVEPGPDGVRRASFGGADGPQVAIEVHGR
jgi:hypothetical protein